MNKNRNILIFIQWSFFLMRNGLICFYWTNFPILIEGHSRLNQLPNNETLKNFFLFRIFTFRYFFGNVYIRQNIPFYSFFHSCTLTVFCKTSNLCQKLSYDTMYNFQKKICLQFGTLYIQEDSQSIMNSLSVY